MLGVGYTIIKYKFEKTIVNQKQNFFSAPGTKLALSMSGWLVGPVVIATVLGHFLDQRYGTKPWFFLISLGLAFTLSSIGLVRTVSETLKELGQTAEQKKDTPETPSDTAQ